MCWRFGDSPSGMTASSAFAFGTHSEFLRLMRLMPDSRMGFYIHRGREGNVSVLEDLVTASVYRAIVPAGYKGQKKENWYVRLLPPPFPGGSSHNHP
jgi:hypothetical protein